VKRQGLKQTWVLLPGLDGTGLLFEPFTAALKARGQEVRIVRYPDKAWSYAQLLDWLVTELKNIPAASVLLAESFAGPLGVMLAADSKLQFSKLILCASFVRCPSAMASVFAPTLNWMSAFAPFVSLFAHAMPKVSVEQALFNGDVPMELRVLFTAVLKQSKAEISHARLRAILNVDVRHQLKTVSIPVLYLQAKQDRLVGAHCLNEIKRIKPDVLVKDFDAPHCLLQVRAEEVAEFLLAEEAVSSEVRFLSKHAQ
jgi:pimeloyl-[acyl-carrier protein] methyl ester esterase